MSKTVFINEDPAGAIRGTVITAEYLTALNSHRHRGLDQDGDGAIDYAADVGMSNAYSIALTPALDAYIVGMPIWFKAAHANTGAATFNICALGDTAIKKSGGEALEAGDIITGQMVCVIYDGVYFQLANPNISTGSIIKRGTLANLTAAAAGAICFLGWAIDKNTIYLYPGDANIGLIPIGGAAAGSISDIETSERG